MRGITRPRRWGGVGWISDLLLAASMLMTLAISKKRAQKANYATFCIGKGFFAFYIMWQYDYLCSLACSREMPKAHGYSSI